jgi:hypothetical protein
VSREPEPASDEGYVVRFDPWPVVLPVAAAVVSMVIGVITTHHLAGSWAGSPALIGLFFRRTRLVLRRRVAFSVGPSGVYFGYTLHKPKQAPVLISWEKLSALELSRETSGKDGVLYVFARARPADSGEDGPAPGRYGPRFAFRQVHGWRLDARAGYGWSQR